MKSLVLALLVLSSVANAFEAGAPVYAKIEFDAWVPAKFISERNDCLILQRKNNPNLEVKIPSEVVEGEIKPGAEVRVRAAQNSKVLFTFQVLSIGRKCYAVERGPIRYALPEQVLSASAFRNLIGSQKELTEKSRVLTTLADAPEFERWVEAEVIGKRDDCYVTDTERVLTGEDLGSLFKTSVDAPLIKVGETVLVSPTFQTDGWVAMKIKAVSGKSLTVSVPHPDAEGDYEEKAKAGDVRALPIALPTSEFSNLKPQSTVLFYSQPEGCTSPYYRPLKISGSRRSCVLLSLKGETIARIAERVIVSQSISRLDNQK